MSVERHSSDEEEEHKIVQLQLLQGGKEPPKKGDNWLSKRNLWSVFAARNSKISNIDCFVFRVVTKYTNTTALTFYAPKEEPVTRHVVNIDFSNDYELMDIYDNGDDGTSDRSNPNEGLEVIEYIEQNNSVVGETGQS